MIFKMTHVTGWGRNTFMPRTPQKICTFIQIFGFIFLFGACEVRTTTEGGESTSSGTASMTPDCRWLTKETDPEQIDGLCSYTAAVTPPIQISLAGISQPATGTLGVVAGDEKLPAQAFQYDDKNQSLVIHSWNAQNKPTLFKIYYVSAAGDALADTETIGTVTDASHLDGCRYIIVTDKEKFIPTNLDPSLQKNGQKIRFSYHLSKNTMNICMAGKSIDLNTQQMVPSP